MWYARYRKLFPIEGDYQLAGRFTRPAQTITAAMLVTIVIPCGSIAAE